MPRTSQNDVTISIGADTYELNRGLEEASTAVSVFGSKTAAVMAGLAATPQVWQAVGSSVNGVKLAITGVSSAFAAVGAAAVALGGSVGALGTSFAGIMTTFAASNPALAAMGASILNVAKNFTVLNTAIIGLMSAFSPFAGAARAVTVATAGASEATVAFGAVLVTILRNVALAYAAFHILISVIRSFHAETQRLENVGAISDALHVSIDYANELTRAFERVGTSSSTLKDAIKALGDNIQIGLGDKTNHVTMLLEAMGIATTNADGSLRNMSAILVELGNKFAGYADNARKAQLANELFGAQLGPQMLQAFQNLGASLQDVSGDLQQTFTPEQYQRMKDNKELTESLHKLYEALSNTVGVVLSAAYHAWELSVDSVMGALKPMFDLMTRMLETVSRPAPTTWFDALEQQGSSATERMAEIRVEIARIEAQIRQLGPRTTGFFGNSAAIDHAREEIALLIMELNQLATGPSGTGWTARITIDTSGATPGENAPSAAEILRQQHEAERLRRQTEHDLDQLQHRMDRIARGELNQFMQLQQGTGDVLNSMTYQWTSYADRVQQAEILVERAYGGSAQFQEQLARIKERLAKQEQNNILETASVAAQTITALWPKSKNAAIAAAVINTAVGVTKALSSSVPPYNFIQAALVAAQGAAQIAAIRSASATGGGTSAPVTSGSSTTAAAAPSSPQMLTISGLTPEGRYGGASVIGLLGEINDAVKNGAALISTTTMRPRTQ